MRLTIDEYSKRFKMSKEMINSKLREKKLDYIIEDSITYIIVDDAFRQPEEVKKEFLQTQVITKAPTKAKTTVATVIALYQRENAQLKQKIIQLEQKIDGLIDDKEQMLRDEMNKIEQLYNKKDEQLKNILELVNAKMMQEQQDRRAHEVKTLQNKNQKQEQYSDIVELKEYLKSLNIKSYQRKVIKRRFLAVYDNDIRVLHQDGKLYLDFSKYDYSDLLSY
ncbi:hypothetical protein M947_03700 [Sulfurimonas hongkongensis]|uniref:DUF3972 domain-containing protein n=1 Tax=Sulfurimonas hongkongensis TaxID=1172190 RepID=T0L2V4_9BACT|nr:hypothetical protein [Sulfurimonas hongkongensis]EQB40138.1 hypothetical protein M947_03700 [Sulfurimonas hongkongensis]